MTQRRPSRLRRAGAPSGGKAPAAAPASRANA